MNIKKIIPITLLITLFSFAGKSQKLKTLLVHDSYDITRIDSIKKALSLAEYSYDLYDATYHKQSPDYNDLAPYQLVIWYTGNDYVGTYFWEAYDRDNQALIRYLNSGGMLWLLGFDVFRDRYPTPPVTFSQGDFAYDYLGIKTYYQRTPNSNNDTVGVPQVEAVLGNPICNTSPVKWSFNSGTMWGIDAFIPASKAQSIYKIGPASHYLANYSAGIFYETTNFKVLTFSFETARLKNPPSQYINPLFSEVLNYFNQNITPKKEITSIAIESKNGKNSIDSPGGVLQLNAVFSPAELSLNDIQWSIKENMPEALIDATGLLISSGTEQGNGTVTVRASSKSDNTIFDEYEVIINNQNITND